MRTAQEIEHAIATDAEFRNAYGAAWDEVKTACLFLNNYHYERPVEIHGWEWDVDFGRWVALVTFENGKKTFSSPNPCYKNAKTEGETMNTNTNTTDTTNTTAGNATESAPDATETEKATDATATATGAQETATDAKTDAPRAPSVIVIDKMNKGDTFFVNLRALCGMASKDETRRVLNRVLVEACTVSVKMTDGENENGGLIDVDVPGSRFVATDGRRLAKLETDRVFAPGLYEVKQATAKTVTLVEDRFAGVYPNWQQVFPSGDGMFETHRSSPADILYACSRLGVILNPDYVFCLPDGDYTVLVGDERSPVLFKSEGFKVLLMPLRIDGDGRGHTALDAEVARRVVAELAEREAVEEKIQARAVTDA